MTLQEFVDELPDCKAVYIAIMPNSEQWEYDLEVEINHGTIGGTYATGCKTNKIGLRKVRKLADELDRIFTASGVKVFHTRDEWDEYEEPLVSVKELAVKLNMDYDSIADMLKAVGTKSQQNPK